MWGVVPILTQNYSGNDLSFGCKALSNLRSFSLFVRGTLSSKFTPQSSRRKVRGTQFTDWTNRATTVYPECVESLAVVRSWNGIYRGTYWGSWRRRRSWMVALKFHSRMLIKWDPSAVLLLRCTVHQAFLETGIGPDPALGVCRDPTEPEELSAAHLWGVAIVWQDTLPGEEGLTTPEGGRPLMWQS